MLKILWNELQIQIRFFEKRFLIQLFILAVLLILIYTSLGTKAVLNLSVLDMNFAPFFRSQMQNLDDLNEQVVISLLTDIVDKLQKENQKLGTKQAQIQVGL